MRYASYSLKALLDSDSFVMADLYDILLVNGEHIFLTSADIDLYYQMGRSSQTFISALIERNQWKLSKGTSVNSLTVTIYPNDYVSNILVGGIPLIEACNIGALDGSQVYIYRAFMPTWKYNNINNDNTITLYFGYISTITADRTMVQFEVKSALEYLNLKTPKNLFQAPCGNIVYDLTCSLDIVNYTTNFTVTNAIDKQNISTGIAQPDGYYNLGIITCLTGVNAGAKRSVLSFVNGIATVSLLWDNIPQTGDTFSIVAGCDKTMATCKNKFNNIANYRGFPFVPPPETAY